jgi:7,8-dihydropterin-6-yl-methyl-4-(beta-D-ribofuranosyl)aminobenzene 5'-phosphate synthase
MKVTIVYDNEAYNKDLKSDWGFSCLVEAYNKKILFDTGADGDILLKNMEKLHIDVTSIDEIFISHAHGDHTGGLSHVIAKNPVRVYIPPSYKERGPNFVTVKRPTKIHTNIYSTGELKGVEQSLVVNTGEGLAVIVGCSHSGVGTILRVASTRGEVTTLIGGLHGFNQFALLEGLNLVCPTHCTKNIAEIKSRFPQAYMRGGAGRVIEV